MNWSGYGRKWSYHLGETTRRYIPDSCRLDTLAVREPKISHVTDYLTRFVGEMNINNLCILSSIGGVVV
jgi:hypothetical protein